MNASSVIDDFKEERIANFSGVSDAEWPGRPIGFQPQIETDEPCELCGHHFAHRHRLVPGCWGGEYEPRNCIWLCPNHHEGIHFLMACHYCQSGGGPILMKDGDLLERRQHAYTRDLPLRHLWLTHGKSIVRDRLRAEGRWHPWIRTVPAEPRFVIPK